MSVWDGVEFTDTKEQVSVATLPSMQSNSGIAAPPMGIPPPITFPPFLADTYQVIECIGRGGYGSAFVVTRKNETLQPPPQYVAKILYTTTDSERVLHEIGNLAQCEHLNIIRQIDAVTNDKTVVLIMEYADGGDLGKEIYTRRLNKTEFVEEEVTVILAQACLALHHIHSKGILHRDVKPANLFYTENGMIKLGDFGLSKRYEETVSNPVGSTVCGTMYYISPEMWQRQKYSKASDMYSVGVILYELMMLERPFQGQSLGEVALAIQRGLPSSGIPSSRGYSLQLTELCGQLLSLDPAARPTIQHVLKLDCFQIALRRIRDVVVDMPDPRVTTYIQQIDTFLQK